MLLDFQDFLGCGWAGVGGRNRAAMIWWRRLGSMSRVEGSVLELVPGHEHAAVSVAA